MMVGMRLIFRCNGAAVRNVQLRRQVVMPIVVVAPMRGVLSLIMMCAVRAGCRPGGLQRHEHEETEEEPAAHGGRFYASISTVIWLIQRAFMWTLAAWSSR